MLQFRKNLPLKIVKIHMVFFWQKESSYLLNRQYCLKRARVRKTSLFFVRKDKKDSKRNETKFDCSKGGTNCCGEFFKNKKTVFRCYEKIVTFMLRASAP